MARLAAASQRIAVEQIEQRAARRHQHAVFQLQRVLQIDEPAPAGTAAPATKWQARAAATRTTAGAGTGRRPVTAARTATGEARRAVAAADPLPHGGKAFAIDPPVVAGKPFEHLRRDGDPLPVRADRHFLPCPRGGQRLVKPATQHVLVRFAEGGAQLRETLRVGAEAGGRTVLPRAAAQSPAGTRGRPACARRAAHCLALARTLLATVPGNPSREVEAELQPLLPL